MSDDQIPGNSVADAVAYLAQDDRAARYLAVHRADGPNCVSCGQPYPCRVATLAEVAAARIREGAEKAPSAAVEPCSRPGAWWAHPDAGDGPTAPDRGGA